MVSDSQLLRASCFCAYLSSAGASLHAAGLAAGASSGARGISTKAAGVTARVCAVLGAQWGDEGKGKLADVLAKQ
jgi:hypothetical protein